MNHTEIKLTLLRSNPALIRQFTVPSDTTLLKLHRIIHVLFQWRQLGTYRYFTEQEEFTSRRTIGDIREPVFFYQCGGSDTWMFRVEICGEMERDGSCPRLVRFRGDNPPRECRDIRTWNRLQAYWAAPYGYDYRAEFRQFPAAKYRFDPRGAARELRGLFGSEEEKRKAKRAERFNERKAVNVRGILSQYTVAELKEMTRNWDASFPSGLRKAEYVDVVAGFMARADHFSCILESFTEEEYEVFLKICMGEGAWEQSWLMNRVLRRLGKNGYVCIPSYYAANTDALYSVEMLTACEAWFEKNEEEAYRKHCRMRSVLYGAACLYGRIEKEDWTALVERAYPGMCADEEKRACWEALRESAAAEGTLPVLPDVPDGFRDVRVEAWQLPLARKSPGNDAGRYIPSGEEWQAMSGGLFYTEEAFDGLLRILRKYHPPAPVWDGTINREVYFRLQYEEKEGVTAAWLCATLRRHDRFLVRDISAELQKLRKITRRPSQNGYTQREWEHVRN